MYEMKSMNPEDNQSPKEVIIKQAENGFIAKKIGGGMGFDEKPIIAEKDKLDELFAKCKKWLLAK